MDSVSDDINAERRGRFATATTEDGKHFDTSISQNARRKLQIKLISLSAGAWALSECTQVLTQSFNLAEMTVEDEVGWEVKAIMFSRSRILSVCCRVNSNSILTSTFSNSF